MYIIQKLLKICIMKYLAHSIFPTFFENYKFSRLGENSRKSQTLSPNSSEMVKKQVKSIKPSLYSFLK